MDEHDPNWVPEAQWVPVTRWKENLLMWAVYLVGGCALGGGVALITLCLLSLLGVPI